MRILVVAVLLLLIALLTQTEARNYAVLVAGSNYWFNYRHQADVAHHYNILRRHGFQQDDIITLLTDDLANNQINVYPGQIFNKPSPDEPGMDYYKDLHIDYSAEDVNTDVFRNIMLGNSTGVNNRPVLNSGPDDNVYLYFSGHGTLGALGFPNDELTVHNFQSIIDQMKKTSKFKKLLIYIEACESGSMCNGWISPDSGVYCMTASNDDLPSWAAYCKPDDNINGQRLMSCLGDEFSANFMEYIDENGLDYTIDHHFEYTKQATEKSPVMRFGDLSIGKLPLSDFLRQTDFNDPTERPINLNKPLPDTMLGGHNPTIKIDARDVRLAFLFDQYIEDDSRSGGNLRHGSRLGYKHKHQMGLELLEEITRRLVADDQFTKIATHLLGEEAGIAIHDAASKVPAVQCGACCDLVFSTIRHSACAFNDYSFKYGRTIHNLCTINPANITTRHIIDAVVSVCH